MTSSATVFTAALHYLPHHRVLHRDLEVRIVNDGRTLLAKSLEISQLIYLASMLSVPQVQSKLFAFLWKNKKDKIKERCSICHCQKEA